MAREDIGTVEGGRWRGIGGNMRVGVIKGVVGYLGNRKWLVGDGV